MPLGTVAAIAQANTENRTTNLNIIAKVYQEYVLHKSTYVYIEQQKLLIALVCFECFNEMWKFLILFLFIGQTFTALVPKAVHRHLNDRIVGGQPTNISNFPWQVSLQRSGTHFCGGAVYNEYVIVTAAHCVQGIEISTLKIRAGSTEWYEGGVLIEADDYKIHENYNAETMINDIAVIHLKSSLTLGTTIKSIPLANKNPVDGVPAVVSGWGTTFYGSPDLSATLQYVDLYTISHETCASSAYAYGNDIKKNMFCAYSPGKDACQGDAGGPLVSEGLLVGIASWGYGCALPDYPGVYTDIAELNSWIASSSF
uniref:Peptidase S1 domain-containing protein n=1 Tax=Glossina brevipalpis TaxID=37001 RepID=A0A1A9WPP5_9MUSC